MLGKTGADVVWAGNDQGPSLVDRLGALGPGATSGDRQGTDSLNLPVPAFGCTPGPAGLRGPRRADGVEGVGLAGPAPVLAVRAVDLYDSGPRRR